MPSQVSAGGTDGYLRKYDAAGNELWTRQFGSTGLDLARGVSADAAGDVYVAGSTFDVFSGQATAGGRDAIVLSFDSEGNRRWTRQFGTAGWDGAVDIAVIASSVLVFGGIAGTLPGQTSVGGTDVFLRRYDISGNEVWTGQFGSSSDDDPAAVFAGSAGVFTVGATDGALPGQSSSGGADAFLRKYDPGDTGPIPMPIPGVGVWGMIAMATLIATLLLTRRGRVGCRGGIPPGHLN